MEEIDPNKAVDFILKHAGELAKAEAQKDYLINYKSSLKSILMKRSGENSIGAQEREAYAHEEYLTLILGIQQAQIIESKLKLEVTAAKLRVEIWKAQQFSNKQLDKLLS